MRQIISASQIDQWFTPSRRDAQELLPHLLRKLITATVPVDRLQAVRIPVGDQIGKPGFDGTVSVTSESPFIPEGDSVWEMGVSSDAQGKANEDYEKRTDKTDEVVRTQTAFVFVTPRVWANPKNSGENWAKDKRDANEWKAIRVLDATDLEAWLDSTPAVARWLARQMGIPVQGVLDIEGFIKEEFVARYGVKWSPVMLIGGRDNSASLVTKWLTDGGGVLRVRGESVHEAALFVAACTSQLDDDSAEATSNRCVFVSEPDTLDLLTGLGTQQVVIALNHAVRRRATSLNAPSIRLISVEGRSAGARPQDNQVDLERIKRKACEEALLAIGVAESQSQRLARESKGSLTALLWSIATVDDEQLPWGTHDAGYELVPLLLAGQWESESESDREAISKLAGTSYERLRAGPLVRWREPEGPLILRAGVWDWMAWDYAWLLLGGFIDADQIKRFEDLVAEVLEEPDPQYELDGDKRWMANLYGKRRKYSDSIIGGLTGSIAQLAVSAEAGSIPQGQVVASRLVRRLLMPEQERDNRWLSLAKWLPDLAEAAPDEFLEAVEALVGDAQAAISVFDEERAGVFPSSMHTHLLWALERLAWSPEYLSRTTILLGQLDSLDPGGQLSNRPSKSLFEIYVPWHPHTAASPTRRMDAIRALHDQCPDEAWSLGVSLLPKSHGVAMPTSTPRWRSWKPETDVKVTLAEYWEFVESLVVALLEWVKDEESRWGDLLKQLPALLRGHRELGNKLASALESVDASAITDPAKEAIATQLREMLTRHKQFPDAEWVLETESLDRLQGLYDKFAPDDLVRKKGWLFGSWPELPERRAGKHDEYAACLLGERRSLIEAIYREEGSKGVRRLAEAVERPDEVGSVLALVEPDDDSLRAMLIDALSLTPTKQLIPIQLRLAWGVIWSRVKEGGLKWAEEFGELARNEIGENGLANLLLPIHAEGPVWDLIDGWGPAVAAIYWEKVSIHYLPEADRDLARGVQQLIKAGRPYRALDVLGMSLRREKRKDGEEEFVLPVDQQIVISLLQVAPKTSPDDEWYPAALSMVSHAVGELLQWLEGTGVSDDTLAQIEWLWMAALEHDAHGMPALQRCLSTEPELFVELLKLVFRADGEEPAEPSDDEQARSAQAYRLLCNWSVIPGSSVMKPAESAEHVVTINQEGLEEWVAKARELAGGCGRLGVCDSQIGQVLAHAPRDADGSWPCEPVRNVIEQAGSTQLDRGFHVGELNKRGAHFRAPGGDQERELAAKYEGFRDRVIDRWPRTGGILDRIRKSYEHEAKWHDARDEFEEFADN